MALTLGFAWDEDTIARALTDGSDLERLDWSGRTALHEALRRSRDLVPAILAAGVDPNRATRDGIAPLHLALSSFDVRLAEVEALLAAGAEADRPTPAGSTPLLQAIERAHGAPARRPDVRVALALLRHGASAVREGPKGTTPLACALDRCVVELVAPLVAAGADPESLPAPARAAYAAAVGDAARFADLVAAGVPLTWKGHGEPAHGFVSLLALAAAGGSAAIVERLLALPCDPDATYATCPRPIEYAVWHGHHGVLAILASRSRWGAGALARAVEIEDDRAIEIVLAHAPEPSRAAALAVARGDARRLARLLSSGGGADLARLPPYVRIPIHAAVERGDEAVVRLLVEHRLDLGVLDDAGRSPLDVAEERGQDAIAALLRAGGARSRRDLAADRLTAWRRALLRERRPWPEWAELEALAADASAWTVEVGRDGEFLQHKPRALRVKLSAISPAPGAPIPAWVGLVRVGRTRAEAGGGTRVIADAIELGKLTARSARDFVPAGTRLPPGGLWPLSLAPNGALLAVNKGGEVVVHAGTFQAIGPVEAFVRYQLRAALDGEDWLERFQAGRGLAELGLRGVPIPG